METKPVSGIKIPQRPDRITIESSYLLIESFRLFDGYDGGTLKALNRDQLALVQMALIDMGLLKPSDVTVGTINENTKKALQSFQYQFNVKGEGGNYFTIKTLEAMQFALLFTHFNSPLKEISDAYTKDAEKSKGLVALLKQKCSDSQLTYAEKSEALKYMFGADAVVDSATVASNKINGYKLKLKLPSYLDMGLKYSKPANKNIYFTTPNRYPSDKDRDFPIMDKNIFNKWGIKNNFNLSSTVTGNNADKKAAKPAASSTPMADPDSQADDSVQILKAISILTAQAKHNKASGGVNSIFGSNAGAVKRVLKGLAFDLTGEKEIAVKRKASKRLASVSGVEEYSYTYSITLEGKGKERSQMVRTIVVPPAALKNVEIRPVASLENNRTLDDLSTTAGEVAKHSGQQLIGFLASIFFNSDNTPLGGICINGETLNPPEPDRPTLVFTTDGRIYIKKMGPAEIEAEKDNILHYIQSPSRLINNGKSTYAERASKCKWFSNDSSSRAAVGIKKDGTIIMVATENESSLSEFSFTEVLLDQGCVDAINLDGSFSAQMFFDGEEVVLSTRATPGGIMIVSREKK